MQIKNDLKQYDISYNGDLDNFEPSDRLSNPNTNYNIKIMEFIVNLKKNNDFIMSTEIELIN